MNGISGVYTYIVFIPTTILYQTEFLQCKFEKEMKRRVRGVELNLVEKYIQLRIQYSTMLYLYRYLLIVMATILIKLAPTFP